MHQSHSQELKTQQEHTYEEETLLAAGFGFRNVFGRVHGTRTITKKQSRKTNLGVPGNPTRHQPKLDPKA